MERVKQRLDVLNKEKGTCAAAQLQATSCRPHRAMRQLDVNVSRNLTGHGYSSDCPQWNNGWRPANATPLRHLPMTPDARDKWLAGDRALRLLLNALAAALVAAIGIPHWI